jgi:hypothetical protein
MFNYKGRVELKVCMRVGLVASGKDLTFTTAASVNQEQQIALSGSGQLEKYLAARNCNASPSPTGETAKRPITLIIPQKKANEDAHLCERLIDN